MRPPGLLSIAPPEPLDRLLLVATNTRVFAPMSGANGLAVSTLGQPGWAPDATCVPFRLAVYPSSVVSFIQLPGATGPGTLNVRWNVAVSSTVGVCTRYDCQIQSAYWNVPTPT